MHRRGGSRSVQCQLPQAAGAAPTRGDPHPPPRRLPPHAGEHARKHLSPFATGLAPAGPPHAVNQGIRVVPGAGTASHLHNYADGLGAGQVLRRRLRCAASVSMPALPPPAGAGGGGGRLQPARSLPHGCGARAPWAVWE
jgi:hypothetical protein